MRVLRSTTAPNGIGTLERVLARIARRWTHWTTSVRDHPVRPTLSEQELTARLAAYDFERPRSLDTTVEDMADLLEHGSLHATHPRYFGLFVPGVREAGVAGDALAALYNPQLGAWSHAPAAAQVERQALTFFRARIGLPESAFACFTTGGSEANLTAVLSALAARFPRHPEEGFGDAKPVFYASDQAHDSFVKIARIAGLGARAMRRVRSDAGQRLDVEALESMIVSHKTLPVPMGAGMFFVRDRRHIEAVFSVHTAYMPGAQPGTLDAYQQTIQWSRRFIGLKVFLTLAELGREGVERIVDGQAAMADLLRQALRASGWTITNDTLLPIVCFCDHDPSSSRTSALAQSVIDEGLAWISEVRLPDERRWLRACITHPDVGPSDVRALVDALDRARARLTHEAADRARTITGRLQ